MPKGPWNSDSLESTYASCSSLLSEQSRADEIISQKKKKSHSHRLSTCQYYVEIYFFSPKEKHVDMFCAVCYL